MKKNLKKEKKLKVKTETETEQKLNRTLQEAIKELENIEYLAWDRGCKYSTDK